MDEAMLQRLHEELSELGLSAAMVAHQLELAVKDSEQTTSESDRLTIELQRRNVFGE